MISIIIPTFKRPELLKRAVASVFAQTYSDWELIISDDESPGGATWDYLTALAGEDSRIRVFQNTLSHGQAGNVNYALGQARGEWVKPLFDDDRLLPQCLEVFAAAVSRFPNVVLVGCLAYRFRQNKLHHVDRIPTRKAIEIVESRHAHLAMCLYDFECGAMPTQMLVRRSAIQSSALMPEDMRFNAAVDQVWFAEILRHGDRMHLAVPLVEEHQGDWETATSRTGNEEYDDENLLLRDYFYSLIPDSIERPSLSVIKQMVLGIRGVHRFYIGFYRDGLALLGTVQSLEAAILIGRWLLRKVFPGYFTATPRLRFDFSENDLGQHRWRRRR